MEFLRILAMLMVTMLHYLDKGGILPSLAGDLTVNGYLAWILELLSIVAVDVYMLISGFFLVESGFKLKRLIGILCQVLFYSLLVPVGMIACGLLDPSEITLYQLLYYVLPTEMEHYWFISAYVTMYFFSPLLQKAVKAMKKEQLRAVIFLLLLYLSVNKSILPVQLGMDRFGYDGIWFMCVYLTAAYLRLYGLTELSEAVTKIENTDIRLFPKMKNKGIRLSSKMKNKGIQLSHLGVLGYFVLCALMLLVTLTIRFLYLKTGKFEYFLTIVCGYNHILTLLAAICLFVGFYHWKCKEGRFSAAALRIAPYTLGVYLLQEHWEVRQLWPVWLGATDKGNPVFFVVRCILSVGCAFLIGILVDLVRSLLFGIVAKRMSGTRLDRWLTKLDALLSGR